MYNLSFRYRQRRSISNKNINKTISVCIQNELCSVIKLVLGKRDIFLHSKTGQFGYSDNCVVNLMGSTRLTSMCHTFAQNMRPHRKIDVTVTGHNRLFVWSYKHRGSFARYRIKPISFINSKFGNITSSLNGGTLTPNTLKTSGHYMYRQV
jgi:hypothetical protein